MKKHVLLAFLFLSLAFRGLSQHGDPDAWTVSNTGTFSTCSYYVCLEMAIQNTSTLAITSTQWVCNTIAPGNSATFSMLVSPAPGYQIVVIDAKATYGTTTITGLSVTPGDDIRPGSCSGGTSSNWVTWWAYTGTHSFSIHEDLIVGK